MSLQLTEKAKNKLVELGFSPEYGARPLKRTIQNEIINYLSYLILKGDFGLGDNILVDFEGQNFQFKKKGSFLEKSLN